MPSPNLLRSILEYLSEPHTRRFMAGLNLGLGGLAGSMWNETRKMEEELEDRKRMDALQQELLPYDWPGGAIPNLKPMIPNRSFTHRREYKGSDIIGDFRIPEAVVPGTNDFGGPRPKLDYNLRSLKEAYI